ncbi:MAG: IS256 family transposase [Nanoarchaeota archaeon]
MSLKYLYFTDKDLSERWKEVKNIFWEDTQERIPEMVKRLMENCLEEELEEIVGASYYKHTPETRKGYRNGYYTRTLETRYGFIPEIIVPRARNISFKTKVFERYKRRQKTVEEVLLGMFLKGVSTREVGPIAEGISGVSLSATTISNITKALDIEVRKFHNRELNDHYDYLIFDGITVKIKNCIKSEKKLVLVAYGITNQGIKELISFKIVKKEDESNWTIFFNDLYRRGITGKNVKLIITDGHRGLLSALDFVYPNVRRQRCWVHKLRNVADKMPKKLHGSCLFEAKLIYMAKNKREAIKTFKKWKSKWEGEVPNAVNCLEMDIDDLLRFFDYPKEHWKKIRTTNAIERNFREVRRRIRTMNVFTNDDSCERIIYAIFCSLNDKWKNKPLKGFME